jgi:P-type Ca2+ transporter type 2C
MAASRAEAPIQDASTGDARWYTRAPDDVASTLGVDPTVGLSAARAEELLRANGRNALPEEKPVPGWQRFLGQYRPYMQIILSVATVVSLLFQEWSTAAVLFALTLGNAVVGLRQEGKAESAMNALKSMVKATARLRRDGVDAEVAAEELVAGDVVLLAAGDQVPADGADRHRHRLADRRVRADRGGAPTRSRMRSCRS